MSRLTGAGPLRASRGGVPSPPTDPPLARGPAPGPPPPRGVKKPVAHPPVPLSPCLPIPSQLDTPAQTC